MAKGIKEKLFLGMAVAAANVAYAWLAWPAIAAICRCAPLAARSSHDVPVAIAAFREWWSSHSMLSGPFDSPGLFTPDTYIAWALLAALDAVLLWAAFSGPSKAPANDILDKLPPPVKGNIHGSNFFLRTEKDFERHAKFEMLSLKELQRRKEGYLYIGMVDDKVCCYRGSQHYLVLAPTGSGKTQRQILQMIFTLALSDESICIFDPKGELYGLCVDFLSKMGYPINRIDFSNPPAGSRWNNLYRAIDAYRDMEGLAGEIEALRKRMGNDSGLHQTHDDLLRVYREKLQKAEHEVSQVVASIFPRNKEKEGNAAFFNNGAENMIKMALHTVCSLPGIPDSQRTLQTALMLLEEYDTPQKLFPNGSSQAVFYPLEEMALSFPPDHPACKAARTLATDAKYHGDFLDTATGVLSAFASSALAEMMSGTDFPIDKLCDRKTATFIITPETKKTYNEFARFYINQMYMLLMGKADEMGGKLPRRMNMIAEELGQLPVIDDLAGTLSISRGKGMRWVLVLQDFARLNEKYGREAKNTIVNNCAVQVLLQTDDLETAEHYSKKFGTYTTRYTETGSSQKPLSWWKSNYSESGHTVAREMMKPSEVLQWESSMGALVTGVGKHPAVVPIPPMYDTWMSPMMGLGDEEHNSALIAERRAAQVHPDHEVQPQWRPEYGSRLRYYSNQEMRAKREKWLGSIAVGARKRRGLNPDDRMGTAAQDRKKEGPKAKGKRKTNESDPNKEG